MTSNITAYICPQKWKPTAVCKKKSINYLQQQKNKITAFLCPSGYKCNGEEITTYLLPKKSGVECFLCVPACEEPQQKNTLENFRLKLIEKINHARKTHPTECEDPANLKQNRILNAVAQYMATDMAKRDSLDSIDSFKRGVLSRINSFGLSVSVARENRIMLKDIATVDYLAQQCLEAWMQQAETRANLFDPSMNMVGIGMKKKDNKIYICLDLVEIKELIDPPDPSLNCSITCKEKITWTQTYILETFYDHSGDIPVQKTKKIPGDKIRFFVSLPKTCLLEKARLRFEVSPCTWELIPTKDKEMISIERELIWLGKQAGNSHTFINEDGQLCVEFSLSSACFIPGEWIALEVWLRGYTNCRPIIWASSWFETKCFTSGFIQGAGLLENGQLIEGGYLHHFQDNWIGDKRLHWYVWFKGKLYWLQASDFNRYSLGERCFIFKNGKGILNNGLITTHGCRWPTIDSEGEIASSQNVSYNLDTENDIIVPFSFIKQ
ncbi:Cysteine-rich secretory protein family protein [Desulfonauticus submarinus]|uniref:Cysteine-rich secretory protein family protein n=1 Tax=Desulfonauticus submarinus TaxID=206665 RepID=A0A1H0GCU7_9BACT|nr:CAP domain-containing protein [Desulfonauticus submarinus]SDO04658.1 Cysteine-rich secretory protein family protein [Desulfonauticus submarinus]